MSCRTKGRQDLPDEPPEIDRAADDTGLRCPTCGYNLTALTSARCPECGAAFVIAKPGQIPHLEAQSFALTPSMFCPNCGHPARGFMPKSCRKCGYQFTLWQRVFGIRHCTG